MEYRCKDGRVIALRGVGPRFVEQILARHPVPGPPTYQVTTVSGEVQTFNHDEKSAKETPGGRELWARYVEERSAAIAARYSAASDFLLYSCVEQDPPPPEEWSVDLALWGLTIPDPADKVRYKVFWIENELLTDNEDLAGLCSLLFAEGGIIDEKKVKAFESFFRSALARLALGESGGAAAGGAENPGT